MPEGKMKAAYFMAPNELAVKETAMPQLKDGEALIRVEYAGICGSDVHVFCGQHGTATYPRIPGHEFSGTLVEARGVIRDQLKPGDPVVVQPVWSCGFCEACITGHDNVCQSLHILGIHKDGGFAQYVKVPAEKVYRLPQQISLKLGALTEPLAVAVHDVRTSGIRAGQKALIIGGGPIGILIGLVAQYSGAEVYISEINAFRIKFMEAMGFCVLDGTDPCGLDRINEITDGRGFDVVYEVSGSRAGQQMMTSACKIRGTIMAIGMGGTTAPVHMGELIAREQRLEGVRIHSQVNYEGALRLLEKEWFRDKLEKIITRTFPLEEFEQAMEYQIRDPYHFKVLIRMP